MAETICLLLCLSLASSGHMVWKAEPATQQFKSAYSLTLSEFDQCMVSLRKDETMIQIKLKSVQMIEDCPQTVNCQIRMSKALLLKEKREVVIIFYDTQPVSKSPSLPLNLFEPYLKYTETVPDPQIRWFLSHWPTDGLKAPVTIINAKPSSQP